MNAKRIEVRWADLDGFGHVHHPTFLTYLEEGRDAWLRRLFGLEPGELWYYLVARVAIDYRGDLRAPEALVDCSVERIGNSSLTTREQVRSPDDRLLAEAEVVIVAIDGRGGRPRPLSDAERALLERERAEGSA